MRLTTSAVYGTVALVLVVTVVSGPLVGAVDFTRSQGFGDVGQGSLRVTSVDAPTTATLDKGYQSQNYYLEAPDARIRIAAITGRPVVEYSLSIPRLDFSRSSTHFLRSDQTGWVALSLAPETFPPGRISGTAYNATLSLVARYNDTEQTLYRGNVTVEVTE